MNRQAAVQTQQANKVTPAPGSVLQRACACGQHSGSGGECEECKQKREGILQRSAINPSSAYDVPPIVHEVLRSPGQSLDANTRAFMEPRFGHDFSGVRVHTDARAAESARAVNALAYTVGNNVVFGAGQYAPQSNVGKRLMAHELAHVVQQANTRNMPIQTQPQIERLNDGGLRIAVAPTVVEEPQPLERQADAVADHVAAGSASSHASIDQRLHATSGLQPLIQRVRVPLPRPTALCGRTLTHVDIEPPRWRPLEPCLPSTVLVNRINIVGRDLSAPTPGRGPQVFNLHIGYYRDPATGRLCAIADDSKTCIAPRCLMLGCFPTLREVLDAILKFLKAALIILGIVALAIIIAIIIELLGPILVPVPLLAAESSPGSEGSDELASNAEPTTPDAGESGAGTETASEAVG